LRSVQLGHLMRSTFLIGTLLGFLCLVALCFVVLCVGCSREASDPSGPPQVEVAGGGSGP
jgi:hypothetical protein